MDTYGEAFSLTRKFSFPPQAGYHPRAGDVTKAWTPIDGVLVRAFRSTLLPVYLCGLESGAQIRTQAIFEIPMDANTLQSLGETLLEVAEMARRTASA